MHQNEIFQEIIIGVARLVSIFSMAVQYAWHLDGKMEWIQSCLLLGSGDFWHNLCVHLLLCQCGVDVVLYLFINPVSSPCGGEILTGKDVCSSGKSLVHLIR
jgi:hypothetical protein